MRMIPWKPWTGEYVEGSISYLIHVEKPDTSGLGLGPSRNVLLAYPSFDVEHPVPSARGVGVKHPIIWLTHPDSRRLAADVVVTHYAEFNAPYAYYPRPGEVA